MLRIGSLSQTRLLLGRTTATGTTGTATAAASAATTASSASSSTIAPKRKTATSSSSINQQQMAMKKVWSPLGMKSSSAPKSVLSGSEMLSMFYRRLPPERTVEAEEDVGYNLVLHREFVSQKATREGLPWDVNPLASSSVERRVGRATIAQGVNKLRRDAARIQNDQYVPSLEVDSNLQDAPGALRSAGYVFDEPRIKYCDRFKRHYPQLESMSALMEAAAIVFGCENEAGREAWFHYFLGLDRASLDQAAEHRANLQQQLEDDVDDDDGHQEEIEEFSTAGKENIPIPNEFADIYASYKAYCSGKSPTFGNEKQVVSNFATASDEVALRKHRWRRLLDALVAEEPLLNCGFARSGQFDENEEEAEAALVMSVASQLNDQLRTLKLLDLRVGESVKEAVQIQERAAGSSVSMRDRPVDMSPAHPDRPTG